MPKIDVDSSIDIAAPVEKIRDILVNFHTWTAWSPWLYIEPDAEVTYRGVVGQTGHGYDWQGARIGSGGMTLLNSTADRVDCDLQFVKPFRFDAEVNFEIQPLDDGNSRVTWQMKSSLPLLMFWMSPTMIDMVQSDYRRGLLLLKDYLETGHNSSSTTVDGIVGVEKIFYVGIRTEVPVADLTNSMTSDFQNLRDTSAAGQFSVSGSPLCLYNTVDGKSRRCDYTAAFPTYDPTPVSAPLVAAIRPACTALKVIHAGPYRHLGNAWALIMAEAKKRKVKILKSQPPFERYLNNAAEVEENDLITEVYLPIKG